MGNGTGFNTELSAIDIIAIYAEVAIELEKGQIKDEKDGRN